MARSSMAFCLSVVMLATLAVPAAAATAEAENHFAAVKHDFIMAHATKKKDAKASGKLFQNTPDLI